MGRAIIISSRHSYTSASTSAFAQPEDIRYSPHTKALDGARKSAVPFRLSGWAHVALTPLRIPRLASHSGSQRSWQSHKKLRLWMRLRRRGKRTHYFACASQIFGGPTRRAKRSQRFEVLHLAQGVGLDGADGVLAQVPAEASQRCGPRNQRLRICFPFLAEICGNFAKCLKARRHVLVAKPFRRHKRSVFNGLRVQNWPSYQRNVEYSQVFQGLEASEGFLCHRLDLVSKETSAISKRQGCRKMRGCGDAERAQRN